MASLTLVLAFGVFVVGFAGGCASSGGLEVVPRGSAGTVQRLDTGTVVSVRNVIIDGEPSGVGYKSGTIAGARGAQSGAVGAAPNRPTQPGWPIPRFLCCTGWQNLPLTRRPEPRWKRAALSVVHPGGNNATDILSLYSIGIEHYFCRGMYAQLY